MAPPRTNNQRRNKKNEIAPEQAFVEGFFRILGQVISFLYRNLVKKGPGKSPGYRQQLQALQSHWEDVEMHALQEATRIIAVSEADKILDSAFKIMGLKGESMADRLRAAEGKFGSELYQRIWRAHKLRNTLAHELGAKASAEEVKQAVNDFRDALYKLGVLS